MALLSKLGIVLIVVFGCLLLAFVAELYYLLWYKKQRITNRNNSNNSNSRIEESYSNHTKEMLYLFCWDKPNANNETMRPTANSNSRHDETENPDLEMGLGGSNNRKDLVLKALGEEGVEAELMRLHNLMGPPRFLFTIKEESKEDLESEDRSRKASRGTSLGDLIVAIDSPPPIIKGTPSNLGHNNYNNPLFESSVEAQLLRLRSSPPPKFKFLRDAEEKLYRRLLDEAQKCGILHEGTTMSTLPQCLRVPPANNEVKGGRILREGSLDDSQLTIEEGKDASSVRSKTVGINARMHNCSTQVLPLVSSPPNDNTPLSTSLEKKSSLH